MEVLGHRGRFVKLTSSDGYIFHIPFRLAAHASRTIDHVLKDPNRRPTEDCFVLPYKSNVVNKLCLYMLYRENYKTRLDDIPDFPISDNEAVVLMDAAAYLQMD